MITKQSLKQLTQQIIEDFYSKHSQLKHYCKYSVLNIYHDPKEDQYIAHIIEEDGLDYCLLVDKQYRYTLGINLDTWKEKVESFLYDNHFPTEVERANF
jgi:ribosomal protein L2